MSSFFYFFIKKTWHTWIWDHPWRRKRLRRQWAWNQPTRWSTNNWLPTEWSHRPYIQTFSWISFPTKRKIWITLNEMQLFRRSLKILIFFRSHSLYFISDRVWCSGFSSCPEAMKYYLWCYEKVIIPKRSLLLSAWLRRHKPGMHSSIRRGLSCTGRARKVGM